LLEIPKKSVNIFISLLAVLLLSAMGLENYQRSEAKTNMWSPPDKSFTIEVPEKLRAKKGEYEDLDHERYKSIKLFGSSSKDGPDVIFQIVILELSDKRVADSNDKLAGLEFLIGGDNENPTKDSKIIIDGLNAREVVFAGSNKCRKGLIIDGDARIFVLGMIVKNCESLNQAPAKRFFESFQLLHKK
jgi:hypothetical protein